jgi:ribose 5-phosphate isomerase RpiB
MRVVIDSDCVKAFVEAEFQGGRSLPKVSPIQEIENEVCR